MIKTFPNSDSIGFIIENQLNIKKNVNLTLQSHLISCIKSVELLFVKKNLTLKSIKIFRCPAYLKNQISIKYFNFKYVKIKSKKQFKNLIETNVKLYNYLKDWSVYTLNYCGIKSNAINEKEIFENSFLEKIRESFELKKLKNIQQLHKLGDLLDTIFLDNNPDVQ